MGLRIATACWPGSCIGGDDLLWPRRRLRWRMPYRRRQPLVRLRLWFYRSFSSNYRTSGFRLRRALAPIVWNPLFGFHFLFLRLRNPENTNTNPDPSESHASQFANIVLTWSVWVTIRLSTTTGFPLLSNTGRR